jgi:predicted enzyme related to lactoylglutathione lyase
MHQGFQTDRLPRARAFYTALVQWRAETVRTGSGSYLALDLGLGSRPA